MAKEFFRWLRGELNGFYITNLNMMLNKYTQDAKALVTEFNNMQFEKGKINNTSLYGIGKTAGIFLPRMSRSEAKSSFKMTETYEVDGEEFSERGLFNTDTELFEFFHTKNTDKSEFVYERTTEEEYPDDINTLSTDSKRSSLVGDEEVLGYISSNNTDVLDDAGNVKPSAVLADPPEGSYGDYHGDNFLFLSEELNTKGDNASKLRMSDSYEKDGVQFSERGLFSLAEDIFPDINTLATDSLRSSLVGDEPVIGYISSEETEVLDDNGMVRPEKVLTSPPSGVAYTEFYGNKFLFLSEAETVYTNLEPSLYIELYKAMQWIRYNGTSVSSLCKIISTVCPEGLVTIDSIEVASDKKHFTVCYRYNETVGIDLKQQRLQLLEFILARKFVQVIMLEVI